MCRLCAVLRRSSFKDNNLKVEKILSVSNLRSPGLKKIVPTSVMLKTEQIMQPMLAKSFFGPSVFFLVKKAK